MAANISTTSPLKPTQNYEPSSSNPTNKINKEKLERFWSTLLFNEKRVFFNVSYSDLFTFSKKFSKAEELLTEALRFAEVHEEWSFWMCCCCNEKFTDSKSHFQHVMGNHLSPELTSLVLPIRVDSDWVSFIKNETWKPVETSIVFPILENNLYMHLLGKEVPPFNLKEYDPKLWVSSNDPQRAASLTSIQCILQNLLSHNLLLGMHLHYVINKAMSSLDSKFGVAGFLGELGVDQTHLCICLLETSVLNGILKFLLSCEEISLKYVGPHLSNPSFETDIRVALDQESFYVLLPFHIIEGSSRPPTIDLSSWILENETNGQDPGSWFDMRTERMAWGRSALLNFRNLLNKGKENNSSPSLQLSEEQWILNVVEEIYGFENRINMNANFDYRESLLFVLKEYFKVKLNTILSTTWNDAATTDEHDVQSTINTGGNQMLQVDLKGKGKIVDMDEAAKQNLSREYTRKGKARIEDDVGKEDPGVALLYKVDKEGALAQSVLQKKKVEDLFDKFLQLATKSM